MKNDLKFEALLETENDQINKLHQIVIDAVKEEQLITQKLFELDKEELPLSSRVADRVASFGGSWKFILLFFTVLMIWIVMNVALLRSRVFDPYPFILLNLMLSCIAALQAPIIMMSQNRKEEKDRVRSRNDYLINLKAEIEIRNLHQKMDLLMAEQMKTLFAVQKTQMEMLEEIKDKIAE